MGVRLVDTIVSLRAAGVLTVVGAVAGILVGGLTGAVIAAMLIGSAGVLAVCNIFLRIGLGEDRERAAEQAAREARERKEAEPERRRVHRPPRRRGD
jgi:LDH2 family malate/lactate/ureidoglycolate dehydrogenase